MSKQKKTIFIILGATGDLATEKIFPALSELRKKNRHFSVIGVSRRSWSDDDFRDFLGTKYDKDFLGNIFYKQVFFDSCEGAAELKYFLKGFGTARFIFYVSMSPALYETTFACMRKNKLMDVGESKILIEKPFGLDTRSAQKLNRDLIGFLEHKQIYRVDHYLGKAGLQAVIRIHEKTDALSDIINRRNVSSIRVSIFETIGVKDRGASYDTVGAFRDVGQNHILQMLAAVSVKPPPKDFSVAAWHSARAQVVESLDASKKIKIQRGQYRGYVKEKNVSKHSKTETFFSIETSFTRGKLAGVPVILESGKKMKKHEASIRVEFKNGESLDIPVEGGAYEHILESAIADRREFFAGSREILAAWKFVDTVSKSLIKAPLVLY
jgi:glucose-6-phosphate 1-dehydrogenase